MHRLPKRGGENHLKRIIQEFQFPNFNVIELYFSFGRPPLILSFDVFPFSFWHSVLLPLQLRYYFVIFRENFFLLITLYLQLILVFKLFASYFRKNRNNYMALVRPNPLSPCLTFNKVSKNISRKLLSSALLHRSLLRDELSISTETSDASWIDCSYLDTK